MPRDYYETKYRDRLQTIPAPGGGGCHADILGISNLGVMAGIPFETIFQDIRRSIPQGSRKVPDKEITDAINKALSDHNGGTFTARPRPNPVVNDGNATLQKIIAQAKINNEADLWESSPLRLLDEPQGDSVLLLGSRYEPDELLFIGEQYDADPIRTAGEWITYYQNGGKTSPHIICNTLNGIPSPTKTGDKTTLRGDGNIASYRYCMAEFDGLGREDQIRFWSAVKLPVVCLIDSGGKSIHAWIDVQKLAAVTTPEQWQLHIKTRLYDQILTPLGVDGACSNSARLSRLPGHFREEKGKYQRLLWLSHEGRLVC